MKKIKLLSLILATLMLISVFPFTVAANDADTTTVTAPTALQDGKLISVKQIVDFTTVGNPCAGWEKSTYTEGVGYVTSTAGETSSPTGNYGTIGDAIGFLYEYDASSVTTSTSTQDQTHWFYGIIRVATDTENVYDAYQTNYKKNGETMPTSYIYDGSTWSANVVAMSSGAWGAPWARITPGSKGFIYIPIECFVNKSNNTVSLESDDVIGGIGYSFYFGLGTIFKNVSIVYEAKPEITGASVTLTNNFDVNFYATVPAGATDVKMTVNQTEVEGTVQADGSYKYTYKDVLPQCIADILSVSFSATVDGETKTDTLEYSIRDYCNNKLTEEAAKETPDAKLTALLTDILYYGAAAQTYQSYNTENLATNGLTATQSVYTVTATDKTLTATEGSTKWVGAALKLESSMALKLRFAAESVDKLTVKITVNGRDTTFDAFIQNSDGSYTVVFNDIYAVEYADSITASIIEDGTTIQTLTYSVNTYIKGVENTADYYALAYAIYAYGASAAAYAAV